MLIVVIVLIMLLLVFLGMPVGFALGLVGTGGLFYLSGWDSVYGVLSTSPFRSIASNTLIAVPMFIVMAEFISRSNIIKELFIMLHRWLERVPGGLGIATILASAGMGALCGSSAASAATISKITIPELLKYKYAPHMAAGLVTVTGTLAIMIPPSLSFIIYGVVTETSIGKLFIAGIIPGLLTATMYCVGMLFWNKITPGIIPPPTKMFNMKERLDSMKSVWPFLLLVIVMLVAIYGGLATTTEAAALGALGAMTLALLMRRIKCKDILDSAEASVKTSTMIFAIIIGAMVFGYLLTITQGAQKLIEYVQVMQIESWLVMVILMVIYLALGCILEGTAILLITLPLTFPLVTSLGFDAIWFGVIIVKIIEIGLVTPPVGINAYIVSATAKIPLETVFRGTGLMLTIDIVSLIILIVFPQLSTWLPSLMK